MKYIIIFSLFPYFIVAQNSPKKVTIDNHLEVNNIDSAGTAIIVNASGDDATGIFSNVFASGLTKGLFKAVHGEAIASLSNNTSVYGGYFNAMGRSSTGIYAKAFSSNSGVSTGGSFESSSDNASIGIKVIANSSSLNHLVKGGDFEANGPNGTAVFGFSPYVGTNNQSNIAYNKGGHFISEGNAGYGVYGLANNEDDENSKVNYGGYFISKGKNGIGVYGEASNQQTSEFSYGGSFHSNSLFGTGLYASGIYRGIHSKGRTLIEQFNSENHASLLFSTGSPGEVIRLDKDINNILLGDISDISDGVGLYSAGSERLHINNDGKIGIGTIVPESQLHVKGESTIEALDSASDAILYTKSGTSVKTRVILHQKITEDIFIGDLDGRGGNLRLRSNGEDRLVITPGGNVAVKDGDLLTNTSTNNLGRSGNCWNQAFLINGINDCSDQRLKKNIVNLDYGLATITALRPVSYEWRENSVGTKLGLIAQEVNEVIPEIVHIPENPEEFMSINYTELIPVLISAMKEQNEMIKDQKLRIESLEEKVEMLTKQANN